MNLSDVSENLVHLPDDQRRAILALIDLKTESEMEKVLAKMDSIQSEMHSMRSEMHNIKDSLNDKIMTTRYLIIGLGILITILKFLG